MIDTAKLEQHARQQHYNADEGSIDMGYWRGILIGIEACQRGGTMSQDWPDNILRLMKERSLGQASS